MYVVISTSFLHAHAIRYNFCGLVVMRTVHSARAVFLQRCNFSNCEMKRFLVVLSTIATIACQLGEYSLARDAVLVRYP